MPAEFVPFIQSVSARLNSPGSSQNSQTTASPAAHTHVLQGEVKVELKREGDRITQIRIQCRCGELIELACEY
jgi:hypothetical protein